MDMIYNKAFIVKGSVMVTNILPIAYYRIDVKITKKGEMNILYQDNDLAISGLEITTKGMEYREKLLRSIDEIPNIVNQYKNKIVDDGLIVNIEYDLCRLFNMLDGDTRGFFQLEVKDNLI